MSKLAEKQIEKGAITRKELANIRRTMLDSGVHPKELEDRLTRHLQASEARRLKTAMPKETKKVPNQPGQKSLSVVAWLPRAPDDLIQRQRDTRLAKQSDEQKAVSHAFRTNPIGSEQTRLKSLHKSPEEIEEKRLKKEHRKMARALTGTKKTDWWSSILDAGVDMIPKLLPLLVGMGDYAEVESDDTKVSSAPTSNSLLAASSHGARGYEPPFVHSRGNVTRVTHREYLGDVYSSTSSFVRLTFPINPGMEETFPWLAPLAAQFTNYRILGMVVDFVSQGTDYANAAGLGYVALATQYNALAPLFVDKRELLNYEFADSVKPSRNLVHWIECKPSEIAEDEKTVRSSSIPANADLRMYDHGTLSLVVGGNTASGAIIGQLWISYDIEFYFPKISASSAGVLNYFLQTNTAVGAAGPFGATLGSPSIRSSIAVTVGANSLQFPDSVRGDFIICLEWLGTASPGNVAPGWVFGGGVSLLVPVSQAVPAANLTVFWQYMIVRVADNAGVITADGLGTCLPIGAGASSCTIIVSQIPRAPTETEIFDPRGVSSEKRYVKFMDKFLPVKTKAVAPHEISLDETVVLREVQGRHFLKTYDLDDKRCYLISVAGQSRNVFLDESDGFDKMFISCYSTLSDSEFVKIADLIYSRDD
jgi:hypothetical protein